MKRFTSIIALLLSLLNLVACFDDEAMGVGTAEVLETSTDTVWMDTVITGEMTGTYTFMVYNKGSKAVKVTQVGLGGGKASPFLLNVDGTWLPDGTSEGVFGTESDDDFRIAGGDSLRVFVSLCAPETGQDEPQEVTDNVFFSMEDGTVQTVTLTAAAQDVTRLDAVTLTESTTLQAGKPYVIRDSLVVANGTTLTLKAGTRLLFHPKAHLTVRGTLRAEGTLEAPVVLRGDRMGNMFDGQPYDRIPAQWGGVVLAPESTDNDLTWCDIHSGTWGIRCDSTLTPLRKLIMDNSRIHNTSGHGFEARACNTYLANCAITNAGGDCVHLVGGDHTMVHCTVGQFYPFVGDRGVALRFSNELDGVPMPLNRLMVVNTLITGYGDDELMGEASERHPDCAFGYAFDHCLINTPLVEGDAAGGLNGCLFEDKKDFDYAAQEVDTRRAGNFSPQFDLDALLFTFTLHPQSRAVNAADASLTSASGYTTDLNGKSRMADGAPDIGAYECTADEPKQEPTN